MNLLREQIYRRWVEYIQLRGTSGGVCQERGHIHRRVQGCVRDPICFRRFR